MNNGGDDIPPSPDGSEISWHTVTSRESPFEDLGTLNDVQMVRGRVCFIFENYRFLSFSENRWFKPTNNKKNEKKNRITSPSKETRRTRPSP